MRNIQLSDSDDETFKGNVIRERLEDNYTPQSLTVGIFLSLLSQRDYFKAEIK